MESLISLQRNNDNIQQQTNNDQSLIYKLAKTAMVYAGTNSILSRTKFKDSKVKNIISLAAAVGITSLQDNTDEDYTKTAIAAAAFTIGSKAAVNYVKENGQQFTQALKKFDSKNSSLREKIFEFNQKIKEKRNGKYNFETTEAYVDYLLDTSKKSLAGKAYENKDAYSDLINRSLAKNDYVDEVISSYFDKRNQIQKRGGFGFFDRSLKNTVINDDGTIGYNAKQITNANSDFKAYDQFARNFNTEINTYVTNNKKVDDGMFDYLRAKRKDDVQLIDSFQDFYNKTKATDDKSVSLKELINTSTKFAEDIKEASSYNYLKEDVKTAFFGDLKIKDMAKDNKGNIFDSSILDHENLFLDVMQSIDKSIRPAFSFIPGELHNFSLVPFDINAAIKKKEASEFKILTTNIDYDDALNQLETMKINAQSSKYSDFGIKSKDKESFFDNKEKIIANIENKIEDVKHERDFINRSNSFFGDTKKTKLNFYMSEENDFVITESKSKEINSFIYKGVLNKKADDNSWFEESGHYSISYSKMFKENEMARLDASDANEFGDYGTFQESESKDNMFHLIKKKIKNSRDPKNEKYKEEVLNSFERIKKRREELIEAVGKQNNIKPTSVIESLSVEGDLLQQTKELEELSVLNSLDKSFSLNTKINIGKSSFFDINFNNQNEYNISDLDITLKESFVKQTLGLKKFDSDEILKGNGFFNEEGIKEEYYKGLIPSKKGTLVRKSESILDWFHNDKEKIGTIENAYFNNFFNKLEDSLGFVGVKKLDSSQNHSFDKHLANVFRSRIVPFLAIAAGIKAVDGLTDLMIPDDSPLGDGGLTGIAAKSFAATRIGFQVIAENTGIKAATQYLINQGIGMLEVTDLNLSTEEMYQQYFEGKETAIRRNRYWFSSGREGFEGGEVKEFRKHLLYKLQHRDAGIYKDKVERFYREDFLPTKLLSRLTDPYLEERRLLEKGLPLDKSEQLFRDTPLIGELLSATIGEALKPTVYYNNANEVNRFARIGNQFLEDMKSFGGYQGYVLSKASDYLFGGKSIYELMNNKGLETRELASVDRYTSLSNQFDKLELGGMFGLTEPLRRLIPQSNNQVKSLMSNNMPGWYSQNSKLNNFDILNSEFNQFNYKPQFTDDKFKDVSLLDRLNVLANINPNSKQFYNYKNIFFSNLKKGIYSDEEKQFGLNAISRADQLVNDPYSKDEKYIAGQKTEIKNIKVDNVVGFNEIISDGKRVKFAGIETDFNKLSQQIGQTKALQKLEALKQTLSNTADLNVIVNQDQLKTVKSDSKGQYIEVYSPLLQKQFGNHKGTYLEQGRNSTIKNMFNKFFDVITEQTINIRKNKLLGNRSSFERWQDSLVIPEYRDWDNINDSFVQPTGDLINGTFDQKYLALSTLTNSTLNKDKSLVSGVGAGYLAANFLNGNKNSNYKKESEVNDLLQKQKYLQSKTNYYSISTSSSNSEIQKTLNKNEQKLFYNLVNEVDSSKINYIEQNANSQLKKAFEIIQQKKLNYLNNTNVQIKPIYEEEQLDFKKDFDITNDYFYNTAMAKKQLGLQLSLIEKRKLNNHYYDELEQNANVSEEELRRRVLGGRNYLTSTIYNNNNSSYY